MNFNDTSTYMRPCLCEDEDPVDIPKTFCYVEGTKLDANTSDNLGELSENVWFEAKPPRLFKTYIKPLVPARQLQISRVLMSGGGGMPSDDDGPTMVEKVTVGINLKKSAVRFLSSTQIKE